MTLFLEVKNMPNVKVDKDLCIACGLCVGTCPSVFSFGDDGKAEAAPVAAEDEAAVEEAKGSCPVGAIVEE
jgi:ferredoxin